MSIKLILLLGGMYVSMVCIGQYKKAYQNFPDSFDSKAYFKLLFGANGSINLPYAIVKVQIKDHPYFLITTKGGFKNYFKEKYKLSDSEAEAEELLFLQSNKRIILADTVFISKNEQLGRMDIHHDSVLKKYRVLDLVRFLNEHCPIPQLDINLYLLAYMFEKRMLFDWNNQRIDFSTQSLLADRYNIQWDDDKKIWRLLIKTPPFVKSRIKKKEAGHRKKR